MIEGRVLVDTGPLVALLSRRDQYHAVCVEALCEIRPPLVTCWPVLTEVAWLLRAEPRSIQKLLAGCDAGLFAIHALDAAAVKWVSVFLRRYRSVRPQLADACLMYLAETLGIESVFTLDVRDFSIFRLSRNRNVRIVPGP